MKTPDDKTEKQLQEWLESGAPDAAAGAHLYDKESIAAYLILFETLKEKPSVDLPSNFSDQIVANLEAERDRVADFKRNFVYIPVAALLFIGISYLAVLYLNADFADRLLQLFLKFKWHIAFVFVCFFIIQYFDHHLLKKMHSANTISTV